MTSTRRSPRSSKSIVDYQDPSSDDTEFHSSSDGESSSRRHSLRSKKRKRSNLYNSRNDSVTEPPKRDKNTLSPKPKKYHPTRTSRRQRNQKPRGAVSSNSKKMLSSAHNLPVRQPPTTFPPWHTLPYHVLLRIFDLAIEYTYDGYPKPLGGYEAPSWLLHASLTCRAFNEPALAILYYSPAVHVPIRGQQLIERLETPPSALLAQNQNSKIRRLVFPTNLIDGWGSRAKHRIDLSRFIRQAPNLISIKILHRLNLTWVTHSRWWYPIELFQALEDSHVRLLEWTWTEFYIHKTLGPSFLIEAHQGRAFESLETLVLESFGRLFVDDDTEKDILTNAINSLTRLKNLTFDDCYIVRHTFLEGVSTRLTSLSFIGCPWLDSDMLSSFLLSKGQKLIELTVHGNANLDLSFLLSLATTAPQLQRLCINMSIHNTAIGRDPGVELEVAMADDQWPSWPSSLQVLELQQVSKWSKEAAEHLFDSLVDASPHLLQLRELRIHAILGIPVRDRAEFRKRWIDRLDDVFLRRSADPNPHLSSLGAWRSFKASEDIERAQRESSQATPRRSSRKRQSNSESPGSSQSTVSSPGSSQHEDFKPRVCEVVELLIDNSKQREDKFTEEDFLDSEKSGDDDWDEGRDGYESYGYAW